MRQFGKDILFTVTVLTPLIVAYLAGSFFLQTRFDGLPVSEMLSKQNVSNSLIIDVPVILVALTAFVTTIWIGRKK